VTKPDEQFDVIVGGGGARRAAATRPISSRSVADLLIVFDQWPSHGSPHR